MRSLAQLMDLDGRRALVAGGAGHVGLAVCEALLELGARVAVLDRDAARCQARVEKLSAFGRDRVVATPCDLRDEQTTRETVHEVIARFDGLDILVHSAAYVGSTDLQGWAVPFPRQEVAAWDEALRVNLTSAFVLAHEARDALGTSGHGSVVLIASIYGLVGPDPGLYEGTQMANPVGYGVSKGGLLQLTRYLAVVLAPRVRVNAISPGGVWRAQPATFVDRYVARTPLGRMATEEDFKGAIAYLASDLSTYVTGHNLVVDGGWTVR